MPPKPNAQTSSRQTKASQPLVARVPLEVRATSTRPLGMPPACFLRDYWQKYPLLIRNAFADFSNPVAPDDLAGLACEELALSRIALHDQKIDRWSLRSGPFTESDFASLPKTPWTLLVQDVDKWDADVAALLDQFKFLPSWRIDDVMVSYAEDGGSVGAHVDQYDVFLLQGLGRRRWQISTDPAAPLAFRDDSELKLLRAFTPTNEWVLEPGDMLYLPPGVPHHGVALGECMTYSIGMRAPSQTELLIDFAETFAEAMPETLRLTDPDLVPVHADGEIDDAAMARVMRAMPWLRWPVEVAPKQREAMSKTNPGARHNVGSREVSTFLRTWFGCFVTRYRSTQMAAPPPRTVTEAGFARAFANATSVQRNPWSRFAWMRAARGATLFAAGDNHACSLHLARLLCTRAHFPLLAAGDSSHDHSVLRTLINAGHLTLVRPRRQRRN